MARVHSFIFASWLVVCCCLCGGEAAQCVPDEVNSCIFRCNGTSFDLAKAFNFPYVSYRACQMENASASYNIYIVDLLHAMTLRFIVHVWKFMDYSCNCYDRTHEPKLPMRVKNRYTSTESHSTSECSIDLVPYY